MLARAACRSFKGSRAARPGLLHVRSHGSHSHGDSHAAGADLIRKGTWSNKATRISWLGLLSNVVLAAGKGATGWVTNSQALIGDAYHQLGDLLSDVVTLGTLGVVQRPPDARFPLGYGKVEAVGTLAVSGLLLSGAAVIGINSALDVWAILVAPMGDATAAVTANSTVSSLKVGSDHHHQHGAGVSNPEIAAIVAVGSITVKEWLYRATMKVAKEQNSSVLAANAWHHRVDSLTSIVALASISGSYFLGLSWLDPVGGVVVSCLIVRAAWGSSKEAVCDLLDESMSQDVRDQLVAAVTPLLAGNDSCELGDVSGTRYLATVNLNFRTTEPLAADEVVAQCDLVSRRLVHDVPSLRHVSVRPRITSVDQK